MSLDPNEVVKSLESAFSPYRCVAEPWDYGQRIRVRVFDQNDSPIVSFPEEKLKPLLEPRNLESFIITIRNRLIEKGFR